MVNRLQVTELPKFLIDFLSLDKDESAFASYSNSYDLYPNDTWKYHYNENCMEIFRDIYQVFVKKFNYKFSCISNDNTALDIKSETDFLYYDKVIPPYYSFTIVLDCPIFWYDDLSNVLGFSSLKGGLGLNFYSTNPSAGGSPFSIHLHYYHNLFSNNIVSKDTFGTYTPKYKYFEPAAIINRLRIRNVALEIKAMFPEMIIEFSGRKSRIRPYDNYGFLENADYVISPED